MDQKKRLRNESLLAYQIFLEHFNRANYFVNFPKLFALKLYIFYGFKSIYSEKHPNLVRLAQPIHYFLLPLNNFPVLYLRHDQ